ncbi:MAG: hypothetical protein BGO67_01990 [Alphaproteobacteria bacterium 41-28]|nr:MAG: hypothetical protein BGO67_01990 [Alphaproteobacteria bacterium 41-28]
MRNKITTYQKLLKISLSAALLLPTIGDFSYAVRVKIEEIGIGKGGLHIRMRHRHHSDHKYKKINAVGTYIIDSSKAVKINKRLQRGKDVSISTTGDIIIPRGVTLSKGPGKLNLNATGSIEFR